MWTASCRLLSYFLLAVFSTAVAPAGRANSPPVAGAEQAAWSEESNGLRGRLSVHLSHVINGTGIIVTHLELSDVSDIGNPMLVTVPEQSMTFKVTDIDGHELPRVAGAFSGWTFGPYELVLPHDSSIRYRIGPRGWGIPGDQAALVDLGSSFGWTLPRDGKPYYLHGVLEIPEAENDRSDRGRRWHGRLDLPPVRIPTEAEPIDPAILEPLIDELGMKMLANDSRVSESAVRELSLIDDPQVISWYVKALKTDSYSLKFAALDRLSRFEDDDALEGLKIGMATRGGDIGSATTPEVAASSAENIRHKAANALARSPHPDAKALLLSMHDDPAIGVRITVSQAAARMGTPESLAILDRLTQDSDARVRREAVRLLQVHEDSPAK
jgi:hypothetical protein